MAIKYYCDNCESEVKPYNGSNCIYPKREFLIIKNKYYYEGYEGGTDSTKESHLFCSWNCALEFLLTKEFKLGWTKSIPKKRFRIQFPLINNYEELIKILKIGKEIMNKRLSNHTI